MALDSQINRYALIAIFPDLYNDSHFKILSEATKIYNCIAWAMGYTDRWVDPANIPGHWWPTNVVRNGSTNALTEAFKAEGFVEADSNLPEDGYEKVILYKKVDRDEWTHASRLITTDIEHSKFGEAWDAQHSHNVLCNTSIGNEIYSYGVAYACMKRKCTHPVTITTSGAVIVDQNQAARLKAMLGLKT